jgi:hypothetical protein
MSEVAKGHLRHFSEGNYEGFVRRMNAVVGMYGRKG